MSMPKKIIAYLENQNTPLGNYVITFILLVQLRNFLECFSHYSFMNLFSTPSLFLMAELVHFSLFYLLMALLLTLMFYYATHQPLATILRVVLPSFALILLAPMLDVILTKGMGHHIYYLIPNAQHYLWYYFFTFFGDYAGLSWGMRIEILLAIFFAYCYLRIKQQTVIKSLIFAGLTYGIIFLVGASPYIVAAVIPHAPTPFVINTHMMRNYFLLAIVPCGLWVAYLSKPQIFMALIKDLRGLRLAHYELMLALGVAWASHDVTFSLLPQLLLLIVAVAFYWLAAIMSNNLADQAIDRMSNPERPLVQQSITLQTYSKLTIGMFGLSLVYALAANTFSLVLISVASFTYIIYSFPPLRLKRVPLLSKFIIALNSLTIMLLGYFASHGSITGFSKTFGVIFLIAYTLGTNFIDIKDVIGDRAHHIGTLPALLGTKTAKIIIGIFFIIAYALFYLVFNNMWYLIAAAVFGGISYYLVNKKTYQEWKILVVYLCALSCLIVAIAIMRLAP